MTLANRLRSERINLGLTQTQLAVLAGIQANAQGHYESGFRTPRADYLGALNGIGMDVQFILMGVRAPIPTATAALSQGESLFVQSLRVLRLADREAVAQVLAAMALGVAAMADGRAQLGDTVMATGEQLPCESEGKSANGH